MTKPLKIPLGPRIIDSLCLTYRSIFFCVEAIISTLVLRKQRNTLRYDTIWYGWSGKPALSSLLLGDFRGETPRESCQSRQEDRRIRVSFLQIPVLFERARRSRQYTRQSFHSKHGWCLERRTRNECLEVFKPQREAFVLSLRDVWSIPVREMPENTLVCVQGPFGPHDGRVEKAWKSIKNHRYNALYKGA